MDIWETLDNAPEYATAVADLYYWSTNYDVGDGPFTLFLDMIGYSDEEFGSAIYGPTVLSKLGAALGEYAGRPQDVRAFVDAIMLAESEQD